MRYPKTPASDPLEVFLDRDVPFALAVTAASAAAVWALAMAARSSEPGRRRGLTGLAVLTGLEAAGMYVARRRRAAQRKRSSS